MKQLLIRGLALSLGLLATGVRGQEVTWRPGPAGSTTSLAKPIAIAVSGPAGPVATQSSPATQAAPSFSRPASPVATLGRPVVIAATNPHSGIQPVSYSRTAIGQSSEIARPVVRGAAPESVAAPEDSSSMLPPSSQGMWRKADEPAAGSGLLRTEGTAAAPPPRDPSGPVVSTPTFGTTPPGNTFPMPTPVPGGVGGPASLFATHPECGCNGPAGGPVVDCPSGNCSGQRFLGGRVIAGNCQGNCQGNCCGTGTAGTCAGGKCGATHAWGHYGDPGVGGLFGDGCGPASHTPWLTVNAEYLLWWMKGDRTPPLVATIPAATAGVGGTTSTVFGGDSLGVQARSGGRLSATYWFSDEHLWGLEVGGFFLGFNRDRYNNGGGFGTDPLVVRPFTNAVTGGPAIELVAGTGFNLPGPNSLSGNVEVVRTQTLYGYEGNFRRNLINNECHYMDFLFGFRSVNLQESLGITENLVNPGGAQFLVNDKFSTSNQFYGGQVGLGGEFRFGDFSVGYSGKVALGNTSQIIQISGSTAVTVGGVTMSAPGGLLTQPGTNIGRYSRNVFSVIPEVGMNVGYNVTDWWRLTLGYNFIYWNNVVRPGEQVNTLVNRNLSPFAPPGGPTTPAEPSPRYHSSDFFAHGLTFGMLFTF